MIRPFKLSELATVLDAELTGEDRVITGISIDSRSIQPGELFIAIKGPHFDGHGYLQSALEAGAAGALVQGSVDIEGLSSIKVADTFVALGKLGAFNRSLFRKPLVAITGSCGKTSVKEMLAAILNEAGETLATKGNLNNGFGAPLTLFGLADGHEFAAIELGTSSPGEIEYISNLTRPDVSVITNAAETHLDELKTVAGVAHEKGFILDALNEEGVAILNRDDAFFNEWQMRTLSDHEHRQVLSFSLYNAEADCFASDVESTSKGMRFRLNLKGDSRVLTIAFWGEHQVQNACCAALSAHAAGLALDNIVQGLENARPYQRRGQRFQLDEQTLVIDETYNANPKATLAAVDQLADCDGHTVMVLGDMLDLGDVSVQRHLDVGEYARTKGVNFFAAFGSASRNAVAGYGEGALHFEDKESLSDWLKSLLKQLDDEQKTILVKGSRGMGMLDIVRSLVGSDYKGER